MRRPLQLLALLFVLTALVPTTAAEAATSAAASTTQTLEGSILVELNRVRTGRGLRPLSASASLANAARAHAASMAKGGYFSHTSADGTRFDRRIARFYPVGRASSWLVGENLLWKASTLTADEAVRMWMASPGHRANIVRPGFRQIGIVALRVPAAPGAFGGREVTIVVTDFGGRSYYSAPRELVRTAIGS